MTSLAATLERAATPLDGVRRRLSPLVAATPLVRRDPRIALIATVHALLALALAIVAPVVLIVIGPIVLGVPHLAGDVRYLVLRRRLPAWWKKGIWVACGALVLLRIVEELHLRGFGGALPARVELAAATLWTLAAILAGASLSGAWRRALPALALVLGLGAMAWTTPVMSRLVFAHLHNVIAISVWLVLFRRRLKSVLVPLAVIAGGTALLVSGATAMWTLRAPFVEVFRLHVLAASDWLAPGAPFALAVGLTCSYAFLQSIHYAVWLVHVPQEDVKSEGTLSFRQSARAAVRDFGARGFVLLAVATLGIIGFGFVNPVSTRAVYLSVASFHGYLEVAMLAFLLLSRSTAREGEGSAGPARNPA